MRNTEYSEPVSDQPFGILRKGRTGESVYLPEPRTEDVPWKSSPVATPGSDRTEHSPSPATTPDRFRRSTP